MVKIPRAPCRLWRHEPSQLHGPWPQESRGDHGLQARWGVPLGVQCCCFLLTVQAGPSAPQASASPSGGGSSFLPAHCARTGGLQGPVAGCRLL